jgi:phospholipid transport system substrate-binding protein
MWNGYARVLGILMLAVSTCAVLDAEAGGPPTDQLRDGVDRIFKILRDPALAGDTHAAERRTAIVTAAASLFDFGEMAKRSLGQHWSARTPAEREKFVALFTDLIQRSYVAKVDQHSRATMVFRSEAIDGDYATVQTAIPLSKGSEMPLEYRLLRTDTRWRVYDISVDGISLVSSYRAQFNKIIRIDSFETLMTKLRSREIEFSAPPTARSGMGRAAR